MKTRFDRLSTEGTAPRANKSALATRRLGLVTLLAVTLGACGGDAPPPRADVPADGAPTPVEVAVAAVETVPYQTQASGTVEALRRVMPGTKILGRIESIEVREGDRVQQRQLLARLESRDLEAAVAQAEAAKAMAGAQLDNARAQDERMRDLHSRGSVTDKALEDATTGFQVARAAVAQAEANLAAARVHLGYAEIKSPISGWVVAKHAEAGDMASPGAPLFTLEDVSRVKVTANVAETDAVGLAEGDPARVEILDRRRDAVIDRILPAGDPASRTFAVQLLLDNADGGLKSGMFAQVSFEHGERQVLLVPRAAVVRRGQLEGLFVVGDGDGGERARLRWIKTGRRLGDRVEILSGLDEGERYVVAPGAGLADGAVVEVRS